MYFTQGYLFILGANTCSS